MYFRRRYRHKQCIAIERQFTGSKGDTKTPNTVAISLFMGDVERVSRFMLAQNHFLVNKCTTNSICVHLSALNYFAFLASIFVVVVAVGKFCAGIHCCPHLAANCAARVNSQAHSYTHPYIYVCKSAVSNRMHSENFGLKMLFFLWSQALLLIDFAETRVHGQLTKANYANTSSTKLKHFADLFKMMIK